MKKCRRFRTIIVWIFAGGEPPKAFLNKIGVGVGTRDMTSEGSNEAKSSTLARQEPSRATHELTLR